MLTGKDRSKGKIHKVAFKRRLEVTVLHCNAVAVLHRLPLRHWYIFNPKVSIGLVKMP